MDEARINEIEARVAAIVWPPVWNEVKHVIDDYVPALIKALREARKNKVPWGYGPMDAEGNYPDELQYYEPPQEEG